MTLIPFYRQGFVACDRHGRILLIDPSRQHVVAGETRINNLLTGHVTPDDRDLVLIKDRKPQHVALIPSIKSDLGGPLDCGVLPDHIDPLNTATTVGVVDRSQDTPYLFILHPTGLMARRSLK